MLLYSRLDPQQTANPNRHSFSDDTQISVMRYAPNIQSRFHLDEAVKYQFYNPSAKWELDPKTLTYTYEPPKEQNKPISQRTIISQHDQQPKVHSTQPQQVHLLTPQAQNEQKGVQTVFEFDQLRLETDQNLTLISPRYQSPTYGVFESSRQEDSRPIFYPVNETPLLSRFNDMIQSTPPKKVDYVPMEQSKEVSYHDGYLILQHGSYVLDKKEEEDFCALESTKKIKSKIFSHWIGHDMSVVQPVSMVDNEMQTSMVQKRDQQIQDDRPNFDLKPQPQDEAVVQPVYRPLLIVTPPHKKKPIFNNKPNFQDKPLTLLLSPNKQIEQSIVIESTPCWQLPEREAFSSKRERVQASPTRSNVVIITPPFNFPYEYCNSCDQYVNLNKVDKHSQSCFTLKSKKYFILNNVSYQSRGMHQIQESLQKLLYLFDQQLRLFSVPSQFHQHYEVLCYKARQLIYSIVHNNSDAKLMSHAFKDLNELSPTLQIAPSGAEFLLQIFNKLQVQLANKLDYWKQFK